MAKNKKRHSVNVSDVIKVNYEDYYFSVVPFIEAAKKLGCWCILIVGARKRGKN